MLFQKREQLCQRLDAVVGWRWISYGVEPRNPIGCRRTMNPKDLFLAMGQAGDQRGSDLIGMFEDLREKRFHAGLQPSWLGALVAERLAEHRAVEDRERLEEGHGFRLAVEGVTNVACKCIGLRPLGCQHNPDLHARLHPDVTAPRWAERQNILAPIRAE